MISQSQNYGIGRQKWNSQENAVSLKTEERFIKEEHFHGRENTAKSQTKMEKENEKVEKKKKNKTSLSVRFFIFDATTIPHSNS